MSAKWWPNRRQHLVVNLRRLLGYLSDLAAFALSAVVAFELRFDGALPPQYIHLMRTAICIWAAAKSTAFIVCTVRWGHWRLYLSHEVVRIVLANSLGSILGGAVTLFCLGWSRSALSLYSRLACFLPSYIGCPTGCSSCCYRKETGSRCGDSSGP